MPFAMTTSKALRRSLVTINSESPRSNMSRTFPLETCFSPARSALRRTDSAMAAIPSGGGDQLGQFARMARDGADGNLVSRAGERFDGGGVHGVAGARLQGERG